ncbi:phage tail protein, partial [Klebsiella pneumoniae]
MNVLVEAQYADADSDPIVLNYYNAANPSVPLSGPSGNGQAQSTSRKGVAQIQTKYGIPATSGTQVT